MKLDDLIVEKPQATCFLRASGDSMSWTGVQDGDILVVDRRGEANADSVCVLAAEDGLVLATGTGGQVWGVVKYVLRAI